MNAHAKREEVRAVRAKRERVARLLSRYPAISERDVREIVEFLRTGRHLDIGLLTADDELRPKLDAFMEQHKKRFRVSLTEAALIAALLGAFLVACWLAWSIA